MFCMIRYHLYSFKNVKNTHGGVWLLVKLQAKKPNAQLFFSIPDTRKFFFRSNSMFEPSSSFVIFFKVNPTSILIVSILVNCLLHIQISNPNFLFKEKFQLRFQNQKYWGKHLARCRCCLQKKLIRLIEQKIREWE